VVTLNLTSVRFGEYVPVTPSLATEYWPDANQYQIQGSSLSATLPPLGARFIVVPVISASVR